MTKRLEDSKLAPHPRTMIIKNDDEEHSSNKDLDVSNKSIEISFDKSDKEVSEDSSDEESNSRPMTELEILK